MAARSWVALKVRLLDSSCIKRVLKANFPTHRSVFLTSTQKKRARNRYFSVVIDRLMCANESLIRM